MAAVAEKTSYCLWDGFLTYISFSFPIKDVLSVYFITRCLSCSDPFNIKMDKQ